MKLNKLRMIDFLNHADTEIEFGRITLISGPNNGGKSAVKDAIEMALTGTARGTDKAGRDAQPMVRAGQSDFMVLADVTTGGTVDAAPLDLTLSRQKGAGGHIFNVTGEHGPWDGKLADKERALAKAVGADARVIRACIHAGRLPDMDPKDQESLLFDIMGLSFSQSDIGVLLKAAGCEDADVRRLYGGADGTEFLLINHPGPYGPSVLEFAYRFVYDRRRTAKKELAEVQKEASARHTLCKQAAEGLKDPDKLTAQMLTKARTHLVDLAAERDQIIRSEGEREIAQRTKADLDTMIVELTAAGQKAAAWEAEAETAVKDCGVIFGGVPAGVSELDKIYEHLAAEAAGIATKKPELEFELGELAVSIDAFSGDVVCPFLKTACPAGPDDLKKALTKLKRRRTMVQKKLAELEEAVTRDLDAHLARLATLRGMRPQRSSAGIVVDLTDVRARLAALVVTEADAELAAKRAAIDQKIAAGSEKIRQGERYLAAVQMREEIRAKESAAQAAVESYEQLVAALGPGGVRTKAIEQPLAALELGMNLRLGIFADGYEVKFDLSDGFQLTVSTPAMDGYYEPITQMSTSERLRIGVAIQDALASQTGLRFLLVDNFDMLDSPNRKALGRGLAQMSPDYDTIVLIGTKSTPPETPDGVTGYWIADGTAQKLEPGRG